MNISKLIKHSNLKGSVLLKDSIWAIIGNGIGNFLLLVAGVIIARMLGKDLYGEYGMVKTTMFNIAAFSTFGLSYTSTKFVSEFMQKDRRYIKDIVKKSLYITIVSSSILCLLLFVYAKPLSVFVNAPELATPFQFLGIILICRAMATTSGAICSGFKDFKLVGINNIVSGLALLIFGFVLTYYGSVTGSLIALFVSQLTICTLNLYVVNKHVRAVSKETVKSEIHLFTYSLPVALQELSYMIATWGATLLITKYASLGEVGIWTAAQQWYSIVLFIPGLLHNVVLAYLSGSIDVKQHEKLLKKMLLINFICAIIPLIIVMLLSNYIELMYGISFDGLSLVLNTLLICTVFSCLSSVLQSDFISLGKNWELFWARLLRDAILIISLYYSITNDSSNAAFKFSYINVIAFLAYFFVLSILLKRTYRNLD